MENSNVARRRQAKAEIDNGISEAEPVCHEGDEIVVLDPEDAGLFMEGK